MEEKDLPESEETALSHPDYAEEIVALVRGNTSPGLLREKLLSYHENDIAEALSKLNRDERARIFNILDGETLSDIFSYMDDIGPYFGELSIRKKADILAHSDADVAVDYLKQLPKTDRGTLIDLMDDESKREIALIGSFDEDEIGSRMTTNFVTIRVNYTVKEAMRALIRQAAENDNISTLYAVDEGGTFCGAVGLKDLIVTREGTPLSTIIRTSYPYVYAHETVDECIDRLRDYSEDSIPVLDEDNKILGVITSQDIVEVVDDEMGDDYAKLAGLTEEEDLREPLFHSLRKRLPWLTVLLFLGLAVSSVVGLFENVVQHLTLIVCFQSLILDMAGNVGTQSLAVTIRVLSDEKLSGKGIAYLLFKEMRVGFFNGLLLGIASFLLVGAYIVFFKGQTAALAFTVSGCTGAALLLAMTLSSLIGTAVPILFHKCKIDPAVASGPLITTFNDLVAVVTYYGLAWLFLIKFLHL